MGCGLSAPFRRLGLQRAGRGIDGVAQAAPFFVDAGLPGDSPAVVGETKRSSNAELQSQQWPQAGLTQIRFTNNHLVYALTWYGLTCSC